MKITNAKYMVADSGLEDDMEGKVIFCDTLKDAKKVGSELADYDSDPDITIWENTGIGEWTPILRGCIPEPEFTWLESAE
jgi:hypothetical protein